MKILWFLVIIAAINMASVCAEEEETAAEIALVKLDTVSSDPAPVETLNDQSALLEADSAASGDGSTNREARQFGFYRPYRPYYGGGYYRPPFYRPPFYGGYYRPPPYYGGFYRPRPPPFFGIGFFG